MKSAFNDVNIITRVNKTLGKCLNCCFYHKLNVCFNRELRSDNICNNCHILDINVDDIFKL